MNIQERREQFSKGDKVFLLIKMTGNRISKRPAEVLEVMRGACRIRIEGEDQPRTVRFNALEPAPPPPPPPKPTPVPKASTGAQTPPQHEDQEIGAWLDMGRQILEPLNDEIARLTEEDQALESEAKAIGVERQRVQVEIKKIQRRVAKLQAALEDD